MAGVKSLGLDINSNNGDTRLAIVGFEGDGSETIYITVTSSGAMLKVTDGFGNEQKLEYTYTGDNKFKGLALSANATTPDYTVGEHEVVYGDMPVGGSLYIVEEIGGTTVIYNGSTIASLSTGNSATLNCAGKKAKSDITVKFEQGGKILYNGNQIYADDTGLAQTVTLNCNGKKFVGDITITPTAGKKLISFTIENAHDYDTTTYNAIEGMTWAEWCESEYNTRGGYISPDGTVMVWCYPDYEEYNNGLKDVSGTDVISDGGAYVATTEGPCMT